MDMNKAFFMKKEAVKTEWHVIDAANKVVGRLATEIADILSGKRTVTYTPHTDTDAYVVVINAEKAVLTKDKMDSKEYVWYTGYRGGQKTATPREKLERSHEFVIRHAVRGMLRKNTMGGYQIGRLKIYNGTEHPHIAQVNGFGVTSAA